MKSVLYRLPGGGFLSVATERNQRAPQGSLRPLENPHWGARLGPRTAVRGCCNECRAAGLRMGKVSFSTAGRYNAGLVSIIGSRTSPSFLTRQKGSERSDQGD